MSTSPGSPSATDGGVPLALAVDDLSKRYGALAALDGARLAVRAGTVHALLGENGAGKTTLMRAAFGLVAPDAGWMQREGRPFAPRSPLDAIAAGLGMVFQHFSLVPAMTVAENIALGGRGRFDPRAAADTVRALAERTGLAIDPGLRIAEASLDMQQRCEILKALARDARLLMLDEPTAVLAPDDAQELLRWLRRFADQGNAVVLVTHRLRDALAISDDITVLRRGRTVLSAPVAAVDERSLARAMVGEGELVAATPPPRTADASRAPVLEVVGLTCIGPDRRARVSDVSLSVAAGEIVGIAAIEGQGQSELLRVLAGRLVPTRVERLVRPEIVGFVPEDRHRDALLLDASLTENLALRDARSHRGRMPWAAFAARTRALLASYDVRAPGEGATARALSGGNQQKFVLGRELADRPPALIVENPTRGLDIRAAEAVHGALRAARDAGTAVVCYSGDLDEVLALADRVLVLSAGRVQEVARDRDAIARAMVSADRARAAAPVSA